MDERTMVDCVANARALAPLLAAAGPRIDAGRELPAGPRRRAARGAHVPHAGAALARRRGGLAAGVRAGHRRTRQGRRLDRVVHRANLGLLDDLEEHAAADRRGNLHGKIRAACWPGALPRTTTPRRSR